MLPSFAVLDAWCRKSAEFPAEGHLLGEVVAGCPMLTGSLSSRSVSFTPISRSTGAFVRRGRSNRGVLIQRLEEGMMLRPQTEAEGFWRSTWRSPTANSSPARAVYGRMVFDALGALIRFQQFREDELAVSVELSITSSVLR